MYNEKFWGICDSKQFLHHIQSYFLFFNGCDIINLFMKFVENTQEHQVLLKQNIILKYEIGLSTYMISKGFYPKVVYSHTFFDVYGNFHNQSYTFWKELQLLGCPLLKLQKKSDYKENLEKYNYLYNNNLCGNLNAR